MSKHIVTGVLLAAALTLSNANTASAAPPQGWELPAMSVPAAHAISKGEGVTVAVIDTGIRTDHPELKGRATEGPDFLKANDKSQPWYGGHGTAMASSVLDVAPRAKVLGLRVVREEDDPNYQGGRLSNPDALSQAIAYATDHGADVISMSIGSRKSFGGYQVGDLKAIDYALSKGVTILGAVGNLGDKRAGHDNAISYPSAYPGVITVAASTQDGSRASFSSVHSYIDIAAPGVAINEADSRSSGRTSGGGTSAACALAAGVSALIVSKYPDLTPHQVETVLERTASHATRGYSAETGYGVINAEAALQAAAKLTPEKEVTIGETGTGLHFGPGDDGTPKTYSQGVDSAMVGVSAVGALITLLLLLGGFWLFKGSRRVRAQGSWGVEPSGPVTYAQSVPPSALPQQNPYQQPAPPQQNPYQQHGPPPGHWPPRH
ncbi:S8 family serine peptidase [Streptomyces sp. NRRL B-3229]|uniref:S8 family serine peptidase n=1 Tax=Streptomyces sp. NRRL B-3229 TaxID=1463836 RepID=UPI000B3154CB|nr:S8 family serine peptidase [Streptomyces sp. NRRL B-3229]